MQFSLLDKLSFSSPMDGSTATGNGTNAARCAARRFSNHDVEELGLQYIVTGAESAERGEQSDDRGRDHGQVQRGRDLLRRELEPRGVVAIGSPRRNRIHRNTGVRPQGTERIVRGPRLSQRSQFPTPPSVRRRQRQMGRVYANGNSPSSTTCAS